MDESRKQFEIMAAKELCMHQEMVEKDRKGNGYNYKPLNLWWKIWKASRAAIEVSLPSLKQVDTGERYVWSDGVFNFKEDAIEAILAAGIKVKE